MWKKLALFTLFGISISESYAADNFEVEKSETITGDKRIGTVKVKKRTKRVGIYDDKKTRGEFPDRIYDGAKWMKVSPEFVNGCWKVMEGLYKRDKKATSSAIQFMKKRYPNSGVGEVGDALTWQVFMLEDFDFRYEKQYKTKYQVAKAKLQGAMEIKGNEAWEHFIFGALMGVEGIHNMRKGEWWKAITVGKSGIDNIEKARKLAPDFVDIQLGDALWLYWRTLIAQKLPKRLQFEDKRKEGIQLMRLAERKSVFLRPTAGLALIYTWVEERKPRWANNVAKRLQKKYPDNILNLQVLGRTYIYIRDYPNAHKTFKEVLRVNPKNERVHYYFGRLQLRQKKYKQAEGSFKKYIGFSKIDKKHRGYAQLFLGHAYARQKNYADAEVQYKAAWKTAKIKSAKKRLKKLEKRKQKK